MQILISQTYIFTLRRNDWQHMHGVSLSLLLLTVVAEALVPPQSPKPPPRRLLVLCPTSAGEIASEISESIAALRRDGSTVQIIAHRLSMRIDAVNATTRMGAERVAHGVLPNAHIVSMRHSPIFPYVTTLDFFEKRDVSSRCYPFEHMQGRLSTMAGRLPIMEDLSTRGGGYSRIGSGGV